MLPNLATTLPRLIPRPLQWPSSSEPVRDILHVPRRAITLLSYCLGIKATVCFSISDKYVIFFLPSTYPSVHTSIVLRPCVSPSFPLWALLHACAILPILSLSDGPCDRAGLSDRAKSYPCDFVLACTLRQIHAWHLCVVHSHQHQGLSHLAIREMWQLD